MAHERLVAAQRVKLGSWCLPTGLPMNPLEVFTGVNLLSWSSLFITPVTELPALIDLLGHVATARTEGNPSSRPRTLLVGPSGCGKSYTLHRLGLEEPVCYLDFYCNDAHFADESISAFHISLRAIVGASMDGRCDTTNDDLGACILRLLLAKLVLWHLVPSYRDACGSDAATFQFIQQSSWGKRASAAVFKISAVWPLATVQSITAHILQSFPSPLVVSIDEAYTVQQWFLSAFTSAEGELRGALRPLLFWLGTVNVVVVLAGTSLGLKAASEVSSSHGKSEVAVTVNTVTSFVSLSTENTMGLLAKNLDAGTAAKACAILLTGKGRYVEAFIRRLYKMTSPPDTPNELTEVARSVRERLVSEARDRLTSHVLQTAAPDPASGKLDPVSCLASLPLPADCAVLFYPRCTHRPCARLRGSGPLFPAAHVHWTGCQYVVPLAPGNC